LWIRRALIGLGCLVIDRQKLSAKWEQWESGNAGRGFYATTHARTFFDNLPKYF